MSSGNLNVNNKKKLGEVQEGGRDPGNLYQRKLKGFEMDGSKT